VTHEIDSYRFQSGITKRMAKTWIGMEKPRPIPWTPLRKPLAECTVALISSAGMALTGACHRGYELPLSHRTIERTGVMYLKWLKLERGRSSW